MTRIIVALGGGGSGRVKPDGSISTYDTQKIDKEIIRLTGKDKPHFLFLAHACRTVKEQDDYFNLLKDIYGKIYGCDCKHLKSTYLVDKDKVNELIEWADIIYEGGGTTRIMIDLWKKTGFDKTLKKAWESGKVMCGLSAGGNCWFKECTTDILRELYGEDQPLTGMKCLGFLNGHFCPHGEKEDREESLKNILKTSNEVGLLFTRCAALEILDDKYRVITSRKEAYAKRSYWDKDKYIVEDIKLDKEFKDLNTLINKEVE